MIFPLTNLLDDFNTGPTQLLTARPGWDPTATVLGAGVSFQTNSTPDAATAANSAASDHSNVWGALLPADSQVWMTYGGIDVVFLMLRGTTPAPTGFTDYYTCAVGIAGDWTLKRFFTTIAGPLFIPPCVAGDTILFRCVGTTLEGWINRVGTTSWGLVIQVIDTSIAIPGYLGVYTGGFSALTIDRIGGGPDVFLPRRIAGWGTRASG